MEEFKSPRSLPCLHTFCQTCLGDYLVRKHVRPGTSFACPTCREAVVLPRKGVAGLRSNFLIQSMLGLLETKDVQEQDAVTGDLLTLDDVGDSETTALSTDEYEKSKRISQTQLLLFQAKEEKIKSVVIKAQKHAETLKQYNERVTEIVDKIRNSQKNIGEKIQERFQLVKKEIAKYEETLLEKIQSEIDVEREIKPFQEEAAFVEEDLASLESITQFAQDVLSSGSLETIAAVTEDVVMNVNKTVKRQLKQLEWDTIKIEIPDINISQQIPDIIGSIKTVKMTPDKSYSTSSGVTLDSNSFPIQELEEEPNVRRPQPSPARSEGALLQTTVHSDPDGIRVYPKYLADEFLVSTTDEEMSSPRTQVFRGSPLALAGFDDAPAKVPPVPLRSFEKVSTVQDLPSAQMNADSPVQVRRGQEKQQESKNERDTTSERQHQRAAVKRKTPTKVFRLTLKLPPATITADLVGTIPTPLDTIHDMAITKNGDISVVGVSSTKEGIYQTIALFTSTGKQKSWKRLHPYEPSFQGLISFALLDFKGQESIALPLPEDSRIRIIPIENPESMASVRTIFHKYKNMLYRPFHVCVFNGKIWSFGLDSFGRDSYDAKSKFDEWHPQSRVWDIETAETTEGPVKADTVLIPSSSSPTYAKIEASTSTMYLCERETVSAIRLADKGNLMWKFGETAKKKQKLKQAQGLCVDTSSSRIFVACQGGDRIVALSTAGQFLQTVISDKQGIKKPTSIVIDPSGQLLVGQANGHIKVYKIST